MKRLPMILRSLPFAAALMLFGSEASANSPYSNRRSPYAGVQRVNSYGAPGCAPRPRYSRYGTSAARRRSWVPGHYELRYHQVWVPGRSHQVWHAARFETRFQPCGTAFQFQISAGYYETLHTPGQYESRSKRVWCPGRWNR